MVSRTKLKTQEGDLIELNDSSAPRAIGTGIASEL